MAQSTNESMMLAWFATIMQGVRRAGSCPRTSSEMPSANESNRAAPQVARQRHVSFGRARTRSQQGTATAPMTSQAATP